MNTSPSNKRLIVETKSERWIVSRDPLLMRILVELKELDATELVFKSEQERHDFIHELFLLSFKDEQNSKGQSPLAFLGRCLLAQSSQHS